MSTGPLRRAEAALSAHFSIIGKIIARHSDASARPTLFTDWGSDPIAAGIVGAGTEPAQRNRGPSATLAPIISVTAGLWAWLGYREEWSIEPAAGNTKRFAFRSSSITIHLGQRNTRIKPQVFRAEWSGWAKWDGRQYGHQAGDAGHPHWQFDMVESLRTAEDTERAATYLAILKQEESEAPTKDFVPALDTDVTRDIVSIQKISKLHFASAAAWWRTAPNDAHAHAPSNEREIQMWLDRTLSYIVLELNRLT